jgi:hypothetical protein
MVNFTFGLLLGYMMGMAVQYYVSKVDKEIKDDRG